jgi:hypothetical protein
VALVVSACSGGSSESKPQVKQGGSVEQAAETWADAARPFIRDLYDAFGEQAALAAEMVGTWKTDDFPSSQIEALKDRFQTLLDEARALPGGTPEIDEVNAALERGLALVVRAHGQWLMGSETSRFALLERGDRYYLRAQDEFRSARPALERVVGEPEGTFAEEASDLSDAVRPANLYADRALTANADMIDALERGDWRAAGKKAAEAQALFGRSVSRLEAVPVPTDEDLRTFLRDLIAGRRLMQAAFGDYRRGIAARDLGLLTAGDRKFKDGYRLVTKASEQLTAVAKARSR